jgi:hypothetical protein
MLADAGRGFAVVYVYLQDGRRLDIEEADSFAHRGETLLCLDRDGHEVMRFRTRDVVAYAHAAYPYDLEFVSRPLEPEEMLPPARRRRRRRTMSV